MKKEECTKHLDGIRTSGVGRGDLYYQQEKLKKVITAVKGKRDGVLGVLIRGGKGECYF